SRPSPVVAVPSVATKKTLEPSTVNPLGDELDAPGQISATMTVPAGVPSLFQSSTPATPSVAANTMPPANAVMPVIEEPVLAVGLMSLTSTVPVAVPSVFHSSAPFVPSLAVKYATEPTTTGVLGEEDAFAISGQMSFTSACVAAVPASRTE